MDKNGSDSLAIKDKILSASKYKPYLIVDNDNKDDHDNLKRFNSETDETDLSEDDKKIDEDFSRNRDCWERFFAQVEPGSIRGSVFSLSILCIGLGCLSIPQRVYQMSIVVTIFVIILAGVAAIISLRMIISAAKLKGLSKYSDVITEYCGKKWSITSDIVIIIMVLGVMIMYQIIGKLIFYLYQ